MSQVLSISSYELAQDETYQQFYNRLVKQQVDSLLPTGARVSGSVLEEAEVLTMSHQMLICVLWLEKIDTRLPKIVQTHYSNEFQTGTNILDLVPLLCDQLENLLSPPDTKNLTASIKLKVDDLNVNEVQIKHEHIDIDDNENEFKIDFEKELEETGFLVNGTVKVLPEDAKEEDLIKHYINDYEDEDWVGDDDSIQLNDQHKKFKEEKNEKNNQLSDEYDSKPKKRKGKTKVRLKRRRENDNILTEDRKVLKVRRHEQTFSCDLCQQFSTNWTNRFRRHMNDVHAKSVKFCKQCDKFVDGSLKNSHYKHAVNIECEDCGLVSKTSRLFKVHQFKVHNIGAGLQCELCPYQTPIKAYFNAHIRTTHGEGFICVECGEKFTHKSAYKCHIKFKHEGAKEFCDQCDFVSTTRDGLSYHLKTVHLGMKAVVCKLCGVKLNRQRELRTHMSTIHGTGKYWSCSKCDYKATTKQLLQEHDRKVHELIFFECDQCPSKFVRKYALRRHMENVHKLTGVKVE